jgi:FtsH-binding integral membrane protein
MANNQSLVNVVISVISLVVLFSYYASRQKRSYWLTGSVIVAILFLIVFAGFMVQAIWFWSPRPDAWIDFPPAFLFILISALPIQMIFKHLLGNDNFVREYLMLPIAILTWCMIGAFIGALFGEIKKRTSSK